MLSKDYSVDVSFKAPDNRFLLIYWHEEKVAKFLDKIAYQAGMCSPYDARHINPVQMVTTEMYAVPVALVEP